MFQVNKWINWIPIQVPNEKKPRKVPANPMYPPQVEQSGVNGRGEPTYDVTGGIDHLNPANWMDYQTAASRGNVGFVLTKDDPYFVIDLDNAWDGHQWSDIATYACQTFAGGYTEVSQSGTGLHIFGVGRKPDGFGSKNSALGIEVYDDKRFIAVTRTNEMGNPDTPLQASLDMFVGNYLKRAAEADMSEWTNVPRSDWSGPEDDEELIAKMLSTPPSAKTVWDNKATVADLYYGNTDALVKAYPKPDGGVDHSSADAALMAHLAFWTGCNHERMDRIFRRSALVRDKYLQRNDYRARTVMGAAANCRNVYNRPEFKPDTNPADTVQNSTQAVGVMRQGYQFLMPDQQMEYFKGCVYITETDRILTPLGMYLKQSQFKSTYGGYMFAMDTTNEATTKCAWEAFTANRSVSFPKVATVAFRPEMEPGCIFSHEGRLVVNSYFPVPIERVQGDVTPFLDVMQRLLPDENDRVILTSYMAACVQYIGKKFQWAPLLQGVQGNGKTFLFSVMQYCLGERFSHIPDSNDLANKFNAWLTNKLFIGIEEVYVGDRRELIDALKPLITNKRVGMQSKGADQYTGDNRANFMLGTNHKDGMRITKNDRRYAPFYTAQQTVEDLTAWGMDGDYFPNLYQWFENGGGARIYDYLMSYQIPEMYNPATKCHRAPRTSSWEAALSESLGSVEQEIVEAIGENRQGFRGGWISSIKLDELLKETGKSRYAPRNKRAEILSNLGYAPTGRVSSDIATEGRPVLYLKKDQQSVNPAADYITAQGYVF